MGSGEGNLSNFHLPIPLHGHHHHENEHVKKELKDIPKGYLAILVGHEEEEQLQRFIIPVIYFNHPLFMQLLKETEEEYGFDHKGPITIPCHAEEFRNVQGIIDRNRHHHQDHHDQHHYFPCFRA
ncbi:hypothetical protein Ancab_008996 [Ancistrocladus abbreviatus]